MAAGARRRLLPAWMGAAGDERAAAAPKAGRRQAKAGPRSAAVVYCMNEAELVDVALAVLAELFALQAESSCMKKEELELEGAAVHHKLPAYVANMDRLGDSELDMTCSQRSTAHSLQSRGGFLSSFLSQSKKGPSRPAHPSGASPTQTGSMLLGKKEPTNHQSAKGKEGTVSCKDGKSHFSGWLMYLLSQDMDLQHVG
ncbi:cell cycle regulator of non-homologous end joining isoform X3 [Ciconia boyciana]|uniref:cell cycle regulator of non-homologous end joining isoform X3 n=1 Tax=Ciconia boyciana TaxID=52775 RepID=UPI003B9F888F